jgi:hypothetical protein
LGVVGPTLPQWQPPPPPPPSSGNYKRGLAHPAEQPEAGVCCTQDSERGYLPQLPTSGRASGVGGQPPSGIAAVGSNSALTSVLLTTRTTKLREALRDWAQPPRSDTATASAVPLHPATVWRSAGSPWLLLAATVTCWWCQSGRDTSKAARGHGARGSEEPGGWGLLLVAARATVAGFLSRRRCFQAALMFVW